MSIDGGMRNQMREGMVLVAKHKGMEYQAEVVMVDGAIRYRLAGGREFKSLSAAGRGITGSAVNGWKFWSVDS